MAWYDGVLEAFGNGLIDSGQWFMEIGIGVWKASANIVTSIISVSPISYAPDAWGIVTTVYQSFLGIGASLMSLYFVIGWCRESIDIKNSFTLENMFRFFLRLSITAGLLTSGLGLIREFLYLSSVVAGDISGTLNNLL